MVKGLDTFQKYFADYEEQYVLIGGAACDILFESNEVNFRANSCDYLCRVLNLCHNIGPPLFVLWYKSTESFRALHFHDSYVNLQSALLGYLLISVVVSNA